ncbi:MAG: Gfo/Idh/MocA family protein, partial [Planctomycetota bacterium]
NQAPHVIDIFVQLAGLPVKVNGRTETKMHHIEVEDMAEATVTYENGATGYFYCSTNEPVPGQMIEIYGDKGKIVWRDRTLKFYSYNPPVSKFTKKTSEMWAAPEIKEEKIKLSRNKPGHHNAMKNFARAILYKEPLLISGESGLGSLELTNAIMLSSFTGKEVKIPISRAAYDRELKKLQDKPSKIKKKLRKQYVTDPGHKRKF